MSLFLILGISELFYQEEHIYEKKYEDFRI